MTATYIALEEGLLLRLGRSILWSHLDVLEVGGTSADGLKRNPLDRDTVTKLDSRLKIHRFLDLQHAARTINLSHKSF